jgi:hypothetical protein
MTGYPIVLNGDHAEFEREHANTPHERPDWPLQSFDARDWAKAFLDAYERYPGDDFLTEDVMIGWFANALMRGYDEHAPGAGPMTISEIQLQAAARALVDEYRKIWPGSWPAKPEAVQLARATLEAAGVKIKTKE